MRRFCVMAAISWIIIGWIIGAGCKVSYANSLWVGQSATTSSLFVDHKARQVNDIITVIISETSSATRSASTTTGRETKVDGKVENWFTISNFKNIFKSILSLDSKDSKTKQADTSNLPLWKFSSKNDYKGTGTTARNDILSAKIACKVIEVLPNKNLIIEGSQSVVVNAEEQNIVLNGVIRPEDITADDTVYSYNVCDAKISYYGKGPLGAKQRRGFFEWLGDIIWPF